MALLTLAEIFDIFIMTVAVGFIFSSVFGMYRKHENYDPLAEQSKKISLKPIAFSVLITAPAIILHELAHKFAALSLGLDAEFHAAYLWLGIGIVLKILNFPFIFFVPGYVSISGASSPLNYAITAFAGPFLNLVLWIGSYLLVKKNLFRNHHAVLLITGRINMFLFIFNMLPIPGFDGSKVLAGMASYFFGH